MDTIARLLMRGHNFGLTRKFTIKPEVIMDDVKPISYKDCADAMLKMWMEGVLTDGEYNRIMDKLNKAHKEEKV